VRGLARRVPGLSRLYWSLREQLILRRGVATLDYSGASIRVHVQSPAVVRLRLRVVEKEPWTMDWLERRLEPSDAFYDVGANVGVYSLVAASIRPGVKVVAIEPAPANFDALCRNLVLNDLAERVVPLPVVLADQTRLAVLDLADLSPGAAEHALDGAGGAAYRQPVLAYRLDDLLATFSLPTPTLMKIDVDGAEDVVLAGAAATLARPELRSLVIELDAARGEEVVRLVERHGFALNARFDTRQGVPLPGIWYGIFDRSR
jgi:FkbM family methyltransferase